MGWLAGWLAGKPGLVKMRLDLTKKRWICDNFMKDTVTFLEGCLAESLGGVRPGWLAGRPGGGWLAGCLAGNLKKIDRPMGAQKCEHYVREYIKSEFRKK